MANQLAAAATIPAQAQYPLFTSFSPMNKIQRGMDSLCRVAVPSLPNIQENEPCEK